MKLMRENLRPLFKQTQTAHAGLLIQRGLSEWQDGEKTIKQELVKKITAVQADELYFLAFKRWLKHTTPTSDNAHFVAIGASIAGRLFTGLPLGGTLETGVSTHHSYGVPMIAGSSVKGAVRAYTERLFAKRNDNGEIDFEKRRDKNGNETLHYQFDDDKKAIIDVLFGADDNDPNAGYLIWHDAWWIPPATSEGKLSTGEQNRPFAPEVVTVHHQNYYNGSLTEALDIENPIPNQQLAVQGGFYFVIEGVSAWAKYAGTLLKQAINEQGLGAKSSSGYGYFVVDDKTNTDLKNLYNKMLMNDIDDPLASIAFLSEDKLIDNLSKDIKKFFGSLDLDKSNSEDCKKVAQTVLQHHAQTVAGWENKSSKNTQKAYKFIQDNR